MVYLLFKKIVKIVICLPVKHLEFLWTRLNVSVRSRLNWNLEVLVLRRGDNWSTWKKTYWSKGENQQQTQPTYGLDARIWTWATLVGGSLVYIIMISELRHQDAMVPLAAAINTGGGYLFVIGFGFRMTWRIMQILEGVMGLCPTAATLSQETKVALFCLSSLAPKFFTARLRVVKQSFFSLSGQYGCRGNKAHWVRWISPFEICMILVFMQSLTQ